MLKSIFKTTYIAAAASLIMTFGGCKDDFYDRNPYCPEGEPSVVSIVLNAPEREQFTRSELQPAQDNLVNSLWLGIFNANTGEMSTNLYIKNGEHGFTAGEQTLHADINLKNINTVSGESRIVAVANPEGHTGCTIDNQTESDLLGLLNSVQSWDDYLKICVGLENSAGATASVQTPMVNSERALVMSGSFVPTNEGSHGDVWDNDLLNKTVSIYPGSQTLAGKVHLRRLLSHITFTIQPTSGAADSNDPYCNIIDIEPVSWQVYNAPVYSWMHERTNYGNFAQGDPQNPVIDATNAGDALTPTYADNLCYKPSLVYTSTDFLKTAIEGDPKGRNSYTFDFWMYENKRQGLESCDNYQKRDLEYGKNTDGTLIYPTPTAGTDSYAMSGVFLSLTSSKPVSLNNKAAYVDIPCVVTYNVKTTSGNNGSTSVGGNPDIPTGATRVANVTYRIHLGYTGTDPDPKDFNSYRNSKYQYNVTVKSLNNVIVEAWRVGDNQPGGFGTVTDVTDQYYELDAHYNAFNIQLSDPDLSSFSFSMQSYESGVLHEIYGGLTKGSNYPTSTSDSNYKYYSWIEFLPTTGENVLQPYPRDKTTLLHLGDFLPKDGQASPSAGWYTVFVNENVYEDSADETGGNWKKYVNQPNRNVWINVTEHISADQASSYYKAKYAFSQKSIQTYYSTTSDNANALGVEHEDENFGMNIRWTDRRSWSVGTEGNTLENENGRWNAWLFAQHAGSTWSNAVNFTAPQVINRITNTNQNLTTIYPDLASYTTSSRTVTVPSLNLITSGLTQTSTYNWASPATDLDPQFTNSNPQYYQGYYACMNRNRDLNGDGEITADEIRWYLPTSGQMLRVILGRNSLKTPIMNYPNKPLPYGSGGGHDVLFHYLTSDCKIIWTEEGMSSSKFGDEDNRYTTNQWQRAPWQVRCLRNLGTNLGDQIQRGNRINVAYESDVDSDTKGAVVRPTKYYGTALRNPSEAPIALHKTNDPLNRLAQYGFEIAPLGNNFNTTGNTDYVGADSHANFEEYVDKVKNTYCQNLETQTGRKGWRVPNQKEIVIMLRTTDKDGKSILPNDKNTNNGYYCVTQEYWTNDEKNPVYPSMDPGPDYRFCSVSEGLAEAKTLNRLTLLRCVRDLTAAEANMTYQQITQPRTSKPAKKVVRKIVRKKKVRR